MRRGWEPPAARLTTRIIAMLSWLHNTKSETLENAEERARERAEQGRESSNVYAPPSKDGLEVEELSAEEFMRLFQSDRDKAA